MNRNYRQIWNKTLGRLVVASEAATNRSKMCASGSALVITALVAGFLPNMARAQDDSHNTVDSPYAYQEGTGSATNANGTAVWGSYNNVKGNSYSGDNNPYVIASDRPRDNQEIFGIGNNLTDTTTSVIVGDTNTLKDSDYSLLGQNNRITHAFGSVMGDFNSVNQGSTTNAGQANLFGSRNQVSIAYANQAPSYSNNEWAGQPGIINVNNATGFDNRITGTYNNALGNYDIIDGVNSSVIGSGDTVKNSNTSVLGSGITTHQDNSVVLGNNSTDRAATNETGADIGGTHYTYAGSSPEGIVSVGSSNSPRQVINVAAGKVSSDSTDAINGSQLYATNQAIDKTRTHYYSVNDGGNHTDNYDNDGATGTDSLAAGTNASAKNDNATAVGNNTYVDGNGSTAIGSGAEVKSNINSASGSESGATNADQATAIGYNAKSDYLGSSAIGSGASTGGINSTVLGNSATSTARDATVVGTRATGGEYSTALGEETQALGKWSLAAGFQAETDDQFNLAEGYKAHASGSGSSAIGFQASSKGTDSTALGSNAKALGEYSFAQGYNAQAGQDGSNIAIGPNSDAEGASSVAIGSGSSSSATSAAALGDGASASEPDSVALGSNSSTGSANPTSEGTVGGTTYQYAGTNPGSVVSVGSSGNERQITNVAAGRVSNSSTDAINGSQLYATNQGVDNATNIANTANTTANKGWNVSTNGDTSGASNVAPGGNVDFSNPDNNLTISHKGDNVSLGLASDLHLGNTTINQNGATTYNGPIKEGDDITNKNYVDNSIQQNKTRYYSVNDNGNQQDNYNDDGATGNNALAAGVASSASGEHATAVGNGTSATGTSATALGDGATASNNNSVALGSGSSTAAANPTSEDTIGGTTYHYAGTNPTSVVSVGSSGDERQITNVAAGRVSDSSTDAINGSQLYATNKAVDSATNTANNANRGWNVSTNGESSNASNVAPGSTVDFTPTNDNLTVSHSGDNVKLGLADNLHLGDNGSITTGNTTINNDGLKNGNTTVNGDGVSITNGPSITTNGVDAGNHKITNVSPGDISQNSTDAVNGSQLYQQGNDLTQKGLTFAGDSGNSVHRDLGQTVNVKGNAKNADDLTDGNIGVVADGNDTLNVKLNKDVDLGGNGSVTAGNTTINNGGVTTNNLNVGGTTKLGDNFEVHNGGETTYNGPITNGDDVTNKNYVDNSIQQNKTRYYSVNDNGNQQANYNDDGATGNNALAAGVGSSASGEHATAVGNGTSATGTSATALGDGATASDNNSVALGSGSSTAAANPTSEDTIGGTTYHYAGTNPSSVVSVGSRGNERQITNVAAGRVSDSSTDAINGSQLYATNKAVDSATNTANNANRGWNVSTNGESSNASNVAPGSTVDFTPTNKNLTVSHDGDNVKLGLADNLDLGDNGSITTGNTTINNDGLTNGNTTVNGDGVTIKGGPSVTTSGIDAGGDKITNVADGTNPNDAVNVSQLNNQSTDLTNKGLDFAGDTGTNVHRNLGQTVNVKGGADNSKDLTSGNIGVVADGNNTLNVKLNKDVNLGDNGSVTTGNTTINNDGLSINNGPSITQNGIDGGNKQITNVAAGTKGTDAVNYNQLTDVSNVANKGWNVSTNGDAKGASNVAPGSTVDFTPTNKNLTISHDGDNVKLGLADNLDLGDNGSIATGNTTINNDGVTNGNTTLNGNGVSITNGPSITTSGIDAGGSQITNVKAGTAGTDAVNVNQLHDQNSDLTNKGLTFAGDSGDNVHRNLGQTVSIKGGADNSKDLTKGNIGVVANGNDTLTVALNKDVNLGSDGSLTTGNTTVNNDGLSIANGPSVTGNGIDAGGKTITNVAPGKNGTDAANVNQLTEVSNVANKGWNVSTNGDSKDASKVAPGDTVDFTPTNKNLTINHSGNNVTVGLADNLNLGDTGSIAMGNTIVNSDGLTNGNTTVNSNGLTIKGGPSVTSNGVDAGGKKVTNVADGDISSTSTDAVNGSQLWSVQQDASAGWNLTTNGGQDKTNIAPGGTVDIGTAPGEKNLKVTQNGSNVQVSMNNNLDLGKNGSVKTGNTTVNNDGVSIANGPSMTSSGINAGGDKITNVADGDVSQNSTDAVNGSQLWNAEQNINNITTNGTKYFHANSNEADSQANGSNSVAIGPEAVANGASSIASGEGATAKGSAAVASGAHSNAEANNATALGANADAKSSGGVALGANSVADRSGMNGKKEAFSGTTVNSTQGAVSVGSAGNERQITNVAGGTEDTDAVNVRQLKSVQKGAVNYDKNSDGTTNYNSVTMKGDGGTQIHNVAAGTSGTDAANVNQLDQMGNSLVHRIRNVKQDADAGTASALAAANLPQSMIPGKSMISAGAGTYQGQSAVSVGLSRLSDNGRVVFKGSMTGDTQGHFGAGVGVGWQW